jgi:hypothetical protein
VPRGEPRPGPRDAAIVGLGAPADAALDATGIPGATAPGDAAPPADARAHRDAAGLPADAAPHRDAAAGVPGDAAPTITPDALELAASGDVATLARHYQRARDRLGAGDGAGCLAAFAAFDQLGGPASTMGASAGYDRGACQMLAGQCDSGRRSIAASPLYVAMEPARRDRELDGLVGVYCRGAMGDRDRLLRALFLLGDVNGTYPAATCRAAYDDAVRLSAMVRAVDERDLVFDAALRIRSGAPRCLAKAGDCRAAWTVAKEIVDRLPRPTDVLRRSIFEDGTSGRCADRDQGTLTDLETFLRATAELTHVKQHPSATPTYCTTRIDRAGVALAGLAEKRLPGQLLEAAATCLRETADCATAWAKFSELARAITKLDDKDLGHRFEVMVASRIRGCQAPP